jgi:phosphohistidine phosphatase
MGKRLAKRAVKPDLILSSPAVRALATAELIAKQLGYRRKHIVVDERLYAVDAEDLLEVIRELRRKLGCVMLFGHNPELSALAHRLSDEIVLLPTCAVAEFVFDAKSWSKVGKVAPVRMRLDYPKKSQPQ